MGFPKELDLGGTVEIFDRSGSGLRVVDFGDFIRFVVSEPGRDHWGVDVDAKAINAVVCALCEWLYVED
ncbi:hypothetical protein NONI108955_44450 [Nocardia ninae]|uniref:Uncharacterized protein n=1 Tax=Nocardia ninae NBRC 108245 TaxID=1210091 RepID=A0A511MK98_9NOCA|nr:hypothetical protein NN4_53900 [Nocardia ninae NBRC 108245]